MVVVETQPLAQVRTQAVSLLDVKQYEMIHKLATSAAGAGLAKNEDEAFVKMLRGQELGIPLMTSLNSIHLIDGKLAYDASFMEALAQRQATTERFECTETSDTKCTYTVKRKTWPKTMEVTWTIEHAKAAGLMDRGADDAKKKLNNWNKYPAQMLRARAKADASRLVAPEALHGMYCGEELYDGVVPSIVEQPSPAAAAETSVVDQASQALELSFKGRIASGTDTDRKNILRDIITAEKDGRLKGAYYEAVKASFNMKWPAPAQPAASAPVIDAPVAQGEAAP